MKKYSLIVISVLLVSSVAFLSACSQADVEDAAKQIKDISDIIDNAGNDDISDPEKLAEMILGKKEEPIEEPEEEPIEYVYINASKIGYTSIDNQYAVRVDTEPEIPEYTIITCKEAKEAGADIVIKPNLYGNAAAEYIDNLSNKYSRINDVNDANIENLVMNLVDGLLYLEYYPEASVTENVRELAENEAKLIYEYTLDKEIEDTALLYNASAVLAKSCYILERQEADDFRKLAEKLWDVAETQESDNLQYNGNRAFAAAELYRMTKQRTYRTIFEASEDLEDLHGVSFNNPGYLGMFAYLSAQEHTDYGVSGKMMNYFFNDINRKIKEGRHRVVESSMDPDNMIDGVTGKDYINGVIDDCKISLMANYISLSVEYTEYVKDRMTYLTGANIDGINYLDSEHMQDYDSALFTLCTLAE